MNKNLIRKIMIRDIVIVAILVTYGIFVNLFHRGIPCIINYFTGLQCPGCGISRMLLSMLHGDFHAAFSFHPFLFTTWPVIVYLILKTDYHYICGCGMHLGKIDTVIASLYIIALMFFTIVRNLAMLS